MRRGRCTSTRLMAVKLAIGFRRLTSRPKQARLWSCLLPSRTDTAWWHEYVMKATQIRFLRGRLYFNDGEGRAPFPSCVVVFGETASR